MKGYSVYKRKDRPNWYIGYISSETLRPKYEATYFGVDAPGSKRKALALAEAKHKAFLELADATRAEGWDAWVPDFFEQRYRENQKLTRTRYLNAWAWLKMYLRLVAVPIPAKLDYNLVIGYLPWRQKQERACGKLVKRNTAITELRVMGVLMREAVRRGFAMTNPCDRLSLARDPVAVKPELKAEEIAIIRAAVGRKEALLPIQDRWMTICFEIALHQSCRLSETQVPLDRINEEAREITWHTKGRNGVKKIFTTLLHADLVPMIRALRAAGALQTCTLPRMAAKEWWDLRRELKLEHTTFHSTRVTVITELARAGVPEQQAMAYAGHASPVVHRIYQRLKPPDLSKVEAAIRFGTNPILSADIARRAENRGGPPAMP